MARGTYTTIVRWGVGPIGNITEFDAVYGVSPYVTAYDDLSDRVASIAIRRGRSDPAGVIGAGTCTVRLRDPDGWFVNGYSGSPIVGGASDGVGNLDGYRTLRVQGLHPDNTTYTRFYGYITRITPDPDAQTATITATDALHRLNKPLKTTYAQSSPSTTKSAILFLITTRFGGSYTYAYSAEGNTLPVVLTAPKGTAPLALIGDLLTADRGLFYVRADGTMQYLDRHYHDRSPRHAAQSTLTSVQLRRLGTGLDVGTVINAATVQRSGGVAQTVEDSASQTRYDPSPLGDITTPYLGTDTDASRTATWIVNGRKATTPQGYAADLDADTGEDVLTAILSRDLHDRVNLDALRVGAADHYIIGIQEDITPGRRHTCRWLLQRRRAQDCAGIVDYSRVDACAVGYTV